LSCLRLHLASQYACVLLSPDPPPSQLYTLSLHDALPILGRRGEDVINELAHLFPGESVEDIFADRWRYGQDPDLPPVEQLPESRSEEHTSELQSRENLVCRLLLEKKNRNGICMVNLRKAA